MTKTTTTQAPGVKSVQLPSCTVVWDKTCLALHADTKAAKRRILQEACREVLAFSASNALPELGPTKTFIHALVLEGYPVVQCRTLAMWHIRDLALDLVGFGLD